jgi:hypothetical protein
MQGVAGIRAQAHFATGGRRQHRAAAPSAFQRLKLAQHGVLSASALLVGSVKEDGCAGRVRACVCVPGMSVWYT